MGMYTGLVLDLETKVETPDYVIGTLRHMLDPDNHSKKPPAVVGHPLFTADGWDWCLRGRNSYFVLERDAELRRPEWTTYSWYVDDSARVGNAYQLSVASSIKNYWNQFALFLDWITPWVSEGRGWIQYECDDVPTLVYWDEEGELKTLGEYELT